MAKKKPNRPPDAILDVTGVSGAERDEAIDDFVAALTSKPIPLAPPLDALLAAAKAASPNDRIKYRDSIATYGGKAVAALVPWLEDDELVRFATLAIGAAGRISAREAAVAALRSISRTSGRFVLELAERELATLGEKGGLGPGVHEMIRQSLIDAARERRFVYYSDVAPLARLTMANPHHRRVLGGMLGAISESEVLKGRPMLSSIVILKGESGVHLGPGFSRLAEQLGLKSEGTGDDEFARAEAERTFVYWQSHPAE